MYNNRLSIAKTLIMLFFIVVVIVIAIALYFGITRSGTAKVSIVVAPADATVLVDGHKVSGDHVYLTEGEHTYLVSRDDFRSYGDSIDVSTDDSSEQYISAALVASNDTGREYAASVPDEYSAVLEVGGTEAQKRGEAYAKQHPITTKLPYTNPLFTIGYKSDQSQPDSDEIILTIRAVSVYRDNAINQIENWGYNPADFNIEFINEENPFL